MAALLTPTQLATAKAICGILMAGSGPLKLAGMPLNSAIGACGNVGQESLFNSTALNKSEGSYGLWQWLGTRLDNLKAWCGANGLDYTTVQGQCLFFLYELPTSDGASKIVPWLYDTSNAGQPVRSLMTLTADIMQYYERPGDPQLDNRIAYANQVAAYLNVIPPPSPPPTPPAPPPTPSSDNFAAFVAALGKLLGIWA